MYESSFWEVVEPSDITLQGKPGLYSPFVCLAIACLCVSTGLSISNDMNVKGIVLSRHGHKSTVMECKWNMNGNWLLTGSRDHLLKVFDIRMMKELQTFRGHKKEATGTT